MTGAIRISPLSRAAVTVALALGLAAGGCASLPTRDADARWAHPKLSLNSYIEHGDLVTLVVGTRPAYVRRDKAYMGVEFAVANNGLDQLTVSREGFSLLDDQGRQFPAVGPEELREAGYSVDLDRRLGEVLPVLLDRFQSYSFVPSNLTPGFVDPVERSPVELQRFSWTYGFLYFPYPTEQTGVQRYELQFDAPELEDPIVVRFLLQRRSPS
ncbi:MAG: hypothetical protein Kow0062_00240 [Acidobacteriota bacterium]